LRIDELRASLDLHKTLQYIKCTVPVIQVSSSINSIGIFKYLENIHISMEGQEIKMLHDFVGNFLYVAYLGIKSSILVIMLISI